MKEIDINVTKVRSHLRRILSQNRRKSYVSMRDMNSAGQVSRMDAVHDEIDARAESVLEKFFRQQRMSCPPVSIHARFGKKKDEEPAQWMTSNHSRMATTNGEEVDGEVSINDLSSDMSEFSDSSYSSHT